MRGLRRGGADALGASHRAAGRVAGSVIDDVTVVVGSEPGRGPREIDLAVGDRRQRPDRRLWHRSRRRTDLIGAEGRSAPARAHGLDDVVIRRARGKGAVRRSDRRSIGRDGREERLRTARGSAEDIVGRGSRRGRPREKDLLVVGRRDRERGGARDEDLVRGPRATVGADGHNFVRQPAGARRRRVGVGRHRAADRVDRDLAAGGGRAGRGPAQNIVVIDRGPGRGGPAQVDLIAARRCREARGCIGRNLRRAAAAGRRARRGRLGRERAVVALDGVVVRRPGDEPGVRERVAVAHADQAVRPAGGRAPHDPVGQRARHRGPVDFDLRRRGRGGRDSRGNGRRRSFGEAGAHHGRGQHGEDGDHSRRTYSHGDFPL